MLVRNIYIAVMAVSVVSLFLLVIARKQLNIEETSPEVRRFLKPLYGALLWIHAEGVRLEFGHLRNVKPRIAVVPTGAAERKRDSAQPQQWSGDRR